MLAGLEHLTETLKLILIKGHNDRSYFPQQATKLHNEVPKLQRKVHNYCDIIPNLNIYLIKQHTRYQSKLKKLFLLLNIIKINKKSIVCVKKRKQTLLHFLNF